MIKIIILMNDIYLIYYILILLLKNNELNILLDIDKIEEINNKLLYNKYLY